MGVGGAAKGQEEEVEADVDDEALAMALFNGLAGACLALGERGGGRRERMAREGGGEEEGRERA